MDINNSLLNALLEQIKHRNITESACLKACGINTSFFSDWKAGKLKNPSFDKIYRICSYLDVSIDYLLGRTKDSEINIDDKYSKYNKKNISNSFVQGNNSTAINSNNNSNNFNNSNNNDYSLSKQQKELIKVYDSLSAEEQVELMTFIFTLKNNKGIK